ncbi:hypothetical protein GDO78_020234 [Eleutherodactylus coqui]|uniref:Uncharacterized protein n=1 Tax=Eleutherodactylus coqui TaxID=57060 RepID=A0A8J6EBQ2_ELECQ|nr:hypothetical protein GDO78_020234 [Eleutherodactylus coqui]
MASIEVNGDRLIRNLSVMTLRNGHGFRVVASQCRGERRSLKKNKSCTAHVGQLAVRTSRSTNEGKRQVRAKAAAGRAGFHMWHLTRPHAGGLWALE